MGYTMDRLTILQAIQILYQIIGANLKGYLSELIQLTHLALTLSDQKNKTAEDTMSKFLKRSGPALDIASTKYKITGLVYLYAHSIAHHCQALPEQGCLGRNFDVLVIYPISFLFVTLPNICIASSTHLKNFQKTLISVELI